MMDVAAVAGVSQATVSLVLNSGSDAKLSHATRQRVQQAAQDLGYEFVRRTSSRSAMHGNATIVFIADEVTTDPWMALAFEGARDKALEAGVGVVLSISHGQAASETMIVAQMERLNVLGFIYGTVLTRSVELPPELLERRTVLVNCYERSRTLLSILPGDLQGGRTATETLLKAGRTRIGFINGQDGVDASRDRLKGYKQALATSDLPFDPDLVRPGNWEPSAGYEMTLELMQLNDPPDAIFCANDMMALGCLDALTALGRKVPRDVSIIGFDDREVAQFTHPPLSTLVLPHYEMGEIAAQELIDGVGTTPRRLNHIKVECRLIERGSVRAETPARRRKRSS
ncbi:MAG: LacI family DNA-binding transcriptional regulator [Devosia sp.]